MQRLIQCTVLAIVAVFFVLLNDIELRWPQSIQGQGQDRDKVTPAYIFLTQPIAAERLIIPDDWGIDLTTLKQLLAQLQIKLAAQKTPSTRIRPSMPAAIEVPDQLTGIDFFDRPEYRNGATCHQDLVMVAADVDRKGRPIHLRLIHPSQFERRNRTALSMVARVPKQPRIENGKAVYHTVHYAIKQFCAG